MPTFHVSKFDFTDGVSDRLASICFKVFHEPVKMSVSDEKHLIEALGKFSSFDTAERAMEQAAGDLGIMRVDHFYEDGYCIAIYDLGRNGILTARGTRQEYGEWAYDTVHVEGKRDFAEQARLAVVDAKAAELSIPEEATLQLMLEEYLVQGPDED